MPRSRINSSTNTPSAGKTPSAASADWRSDPRFARFVALFNSARFFRAHEVLEELWLQIEGPDRPFLQGLIQLAVALEHDARKNPRGALKVLRSAEKRLAPFGDRHLGIPAGDLQARVGEYLAGRASSAPRFPAMRRLPGRTPLSSLKSVAKPKARPMSRIAALPSAKTAPKTRAKGSAVSAGKTSGTTGGLTRAGAKGSAISAGKTSGTTGGLARAGAKAAQGQSGKWAKETSEAKSTRAIAILDGLRRLYPEAKCEMGHGSALELLVATILSAQCTDVRVNMTTPALFARYRDAAGYAGADFDELCTIIKSTGFFNNKARSIIALGKALVERHGGEVPATMEELVELPGVGRKTANVLLSEWYGRPGIAVDTHVIRLTGPVWRLTKESDPVKIEFALYDLLPEEHRSFFGIATIFHGRRVCFARKPNCSGCALSVMCPTAFAWGVAPR